MINWVTAVKVAAVGFAGVFVILTILYVIIDIVARAIHRFVPEKKEENLPEGG